MVSLLVGVEEGGGCSHKPKSMVGLCHVKLMHGCYYFFTFITSMYTIT